MQPQGEVTNAEFREAIRMLSKAVTNQVRKQRGDGQDMADTLRIWDFLRMKTTSFTSLTTTEDPENFVEELKKELKKAKVQEFLTLTQDSLSVYEYALKFTQLSHYAPEIVKNMRNKMSLFVGVLGRASSKEGSAVCYKCGLTGNLMREWPKSNQAGGNGCNRDQSSSAAPSNMVAPKGVNFGDDGGTKHLYALNNFKE
ncbi:uncharacterized protein [Solanum lycopersicum]|uniref:uncharacterized protein n=1 Tax=Solanum lycopersicum TaxID=4081 RepID=UPI0037494596